MYVIYNATQGAECIFRATGKAELWDPWTGTSRELPVLAQTDGTTKLSLPLTKDEIQVIVFSPGKAALCAASQISNLKSQIPLDGDWEFELQPTSDNRFGDFHWPPTPAKIGAEVRQLWYCEGDNANGPWRKVTCSFGPQFVKYGPLPAMAGLPEAGGKPYEFSWRWGAEGDPGHQGYHGLKENITDQFICLGALKSGRNETLYNLEKDGPRYYLQTSVIAPRAGLAQIVTDGLSPTTIWLNGTVVTETAMLKAGANNLLVCYDKPGRAALIVTMGDAPLAPANGLAMRWHNNPNVLPFDVRAGEQTPLGWYRFTAPPGLRAMTINARGKVQAWADGKKLKVTGNRIVMPTPPESVLLCIEQERGYYAGAAIPEPIQLDCAAGRIALGDWSQIDGLLSYSGGAWYRKTLIIDPAKQVVLDLGNVVASAEVRVNGQPAGVRVAPPWRFDITTLVKPGANRIEVLVCNTLANHYTTVPTRYRGNTTSGLLGPVTLQLTK